MRIDCSRRAVTTGELNKSVIKNGLDSEVERGALNKNPDTNIRTVGISGGGWVVVVITALQARRIRAPLGDPELQHPKPAATWQRDPMLAALQRTDR